MAAITAVIAAAITSLADGMFSFFGHSLRFSISVIHLVHNILQFNLDDAEDINRVSSDMCRYLLHLLCCDPTVKMFLFTFHCLSLYGAVSWNLKLLEVAFNNVFRKI